MMPLLLQPLETLTDDTGQVLVNIEHAPNEHLLYLRWFGNLTGPQVIKVANHTLQLRFANDYQLLLNDKRTSTGDWSEALDWLEYEWLPRATTRGLRAIAYVFAPDMHNQLASFQFVERFRQYVSIEIFYDLPEAWQWLSRQAERSKL